ncbi:hypothetical protein DRN62_00610 [Nanoarchaeota archaeon]|nr:MAG: hypothetical protein DRN62_00610 [Nanoarchaeota archaeon]
MEDWKKKLKEAVKEAKAYLKKEGFKVKGVHVGLSGRGPLVLDTNKGVFLAYTKHFDKSQFAGMTLKLLKELKKPLDEIGVPEDVNMSLEEQGKTGGVIGLAHLIRKFGVQELEKSPYANAPEIKETMEYLKRTGSIGKKKVYIIYCE